MYRLSRWGGVYQFGRFTLDPTSRALRFDQATVHLSALLFDLLHLLVVNSDRLVARDEVRAALWPGRRVEEGSLKQAVFALRQALARHDPDARLIVTVSGKGFRFAAPVVFQAGGALVPEYVVAVEAPPRRVSTLTKFALAGGCIMLAAGGLGWAAFGRSTQPRNVVSAAFANRTGDAAFDHVPQTLVDLDLRQSPHLNVLTDGQVASTLAYMRAPSDSPLTPALASEVCKRIDGGVVVDGAVDRIGSRYLVTAMAADCLTGRVLTSGRSEFAVKEEAPAAFDRLAAGLRDRLGESLWSVARHRLPVERRVTTGSFEALQAYSEALALGRSGRSAEEAPLLRQAVALDPKFASGWASLAEFYAGYGQDDEALKAVRQAYALRDTVSAKERLNIEVDYDDFADNDPWSAIRALNAWLAFHDFDAAAWCDLGGESLDAGRFADAITPLRRCVSSRTATEAGYANLMVALAHADRIAEARNVAAEARRSNVAGDLVGRRDADLAFVQGDQRVMAKLVASAQGTPGEAWILYDAFQAALAQGRIGVANDLEHRAEAAASRGGEATYRLPLYAAPRYALDLIDLGFQARGAARIATLQEPSDPDLQTYALAVAGDPAKASRSLAARLRADRRDPILTNNVAPRVRAAIFERQGRLSEALHQFVDADTHDEIDFAMDYQHGLLALRADRPAEAAAAFRDIIDHPGRDPVSPRLPLAHLGLARALTRLGNRIDAHAQYQALFKLWTLADGDLPPLLAAKREDRLSATTPP